MRTMMKIHMDNEAASRAIDDGTLSQVMTRTLERLQPEAAYFGPEDGIRTAFLVFDLADPSQMPPITEPLFRTLNARIEMFPVMNREELGKGLAELGAE